MSISLDHWFPTFRMKNQALQSSLTSSALQMKAPNHSPNHAVLCCWTSDSWNVYFKKLSNKVGKTVDFVYATQLVQILAGKRYPDWDCVASHRTSKQIPKYNISLVYNHCSPRPLKYSVFYLVCYLQLYIVGTDSVVYIPRVNIICIVT